MNIKNYIMLILHVQMPFCVVDMSETGCRSGMFPDYAVQSTYSVSTVVLKHGLQECVAEGDNLELR